MHDSAGHKALTDILSRQQTFSPDGNLNAPSVQPLNIPPSRARRTLQERLLRRTQAQSGGGGGRGGNAGDEPDGEGEGGAPEIDLDAAEPAHDGLEISGVMRTMRPGTSHKFSGLFTTSSDEDGDDSSEGDEDDAGRDLTVGREGGDFEDDDVEGERVGLQTRATGRRLLDDDDEEGEEGGGRRLSLSAGEGGPFADSAGEEDEGEDSSGDEGMVEIRTRRTSS